MASLEQQGAYIWNTTDFLCHLGCHAGLPMSCPSAGVMPPLTAQQMMSPPWEEHLQKQESCSKEAKKSFMLLWFWGLHTHIHVWGLSFMAIPDF